MNNIKESNYIIAEIDIKEEDINKAIRIINSFENSNIGKDTNDDNIGKSFYENEKEIKESCEIKINDEIIPFSYFYQFKEKRKYIIKYSFKHYLSKTNHLFIFCKNLISIDMSNFKSQNIINTRAMFSGCESLININLSNFNTKNVFNIKYMFCDCKSLINLNLLNFNTQNVTDMSGMFYGCNSLTNLNLSNFITKNAINMSCMFYGCEALTKLDLSNFITQNPINLSNIFSGCNSLTKDNVIIKDKNIIKQFEN